MSKKVSIRIGAGAGFDEAQMEKVLEAIEKGDIAAQKADDVSLSLVDRTKIVKTLSELLFNLTQSINLIAKNGTYTLTADLTSMSNGIVIEGQNNTVIDGGGKSFNIPNLQNVIFKNITFQNFGNLQFTTPTNITFDNCKFNNFVTYGVTLTNYNNIKFINGCKWNTIGSTSVNPTYQGCGIYANVGDKLFVDNFEMLNIYGQAGIFLINSTNFNIKRFSIHDTFYRAINLYTGTFTGLIEDGDMYNCGSINNTTSGVGCNAIYAMGSADQSGVTARRLKIKNVLENALECGFGLIEYIEIDGTGIDTTNHATPSIEGIWIQGQSYLKTIKHVRMRNIAGEGIKNFSNGVALNNIHLFDIVVDEDTANLSTYAINLNSTVSYSNILIDGLVAKGKTPVFMANRACTDVYVSGVKSINAGFSMPANNYVRTKDGHLYNAIQNKDFTSWANATSLNNWTAQSATLSQVVDDNSYIPQLTVTAGGFPGRIVQDIYLPKGARSYYLRLMFKGNTNLTLKVTPYNIDGTTLNTGSAVSINSSSFSTTAFQEITLMISTGASKVQLYIGTSTSTQGDNITIQSIQERVIY